MAYEANRTKLDHRPRVSFIAFPGGGHPYVIICKKIRIPATARMVTTTKKTKGTKTTITKNTFFPAFDQLDLSVGREGKLWKGALIYAEHNLTRKRATQDETFTEQQFLDVLQERIQTPADFLSVTFSFQPMDNDLVLEIKGQKENGAPIQYNKPCLLKSATGFADFEKTVVSLQTEKFVRYCRAGKLPKAKLVHRRGYLDINRFGDDGMGWNCLQQACVGGQTAVVCWLIDECHMDIHTSSPCDGYTPLHCACRKGRLDTIQALLQRGADLNKPCNSAESPASLLISFNHVDVCESLFGRDSAYVQGLIAGHGTRRKGFDGMFVLLRPNNGEKNREYLSTYQPEVEEGMESTEANITEIESLNDVTILSENG